MTTMEMTVAPAAAGTIDQDPAVATPTAAFCADPVIRWVFADARAYLRAFPELAKMMAGEIGAADSPPLWPMVRPAGGAR
jgi:hypothetical protein